MSYEDLLIRCAHFESLAKKKKRGKWHDLPEGWSTKSRKQYGESLTEGKEHFFTECVEKIKDNVDDPNRFCGALKARVKGKKKKKK